MQINHGADVEAIVARDRIAHRDRFAFMGDKAPVFDEDHAGFIAANTLAARWGCNVRDSAHASQCEPQSVPTGAPSASTQPSRGAVMHGARSMRDLARSSQYN